MEGSNQDVREEDKPTVLWEKCVQQSIFVDLSEDESLHFSDLEASLNLHISQAESAASEASIHFSESAQLSSLEESSGSSVVSSQSGGVVENNSPSRVSAPRPNTSQEELPVSAGGEDSGQDTSDEDQEDLPFDEDLGSPHFNQTVVSVDNVSSDGSVAAHPSPDVPTPPGLTTRNDCKVPEGSGISKAAAPSGPGPVDMNQLLLRHFSREQLLQSVGLIEAETLPEVSLLESVDDTVLSSAKNSSTSESRQSFSARMTEGTMNEASKSSGSQEEAGADDVTTSEGRRLMSARTDSDPSREGRRAAEVPKQRSHECVGPVSAPFVRTRSFSEIKYGRGQVHYPLPDFSKVAPKVKIPKAPAAPAKPVPQSPNIMHRAQSSPGMLDVISRVLEDSVPPSEKPFVFKHEESPPALVHHLQAEYDKLLTKYAEAENLIDQMRLGTTTSSEMMLQPDAEYDQDQITDDDQNENVAEGNPLGSTASHVPSSGVKRGNDPGPGFTEGAAEHQSFAEEASAALLIQPEGLSDGDRMTAELSDIIRQFVQNVNEFEVGVGSMSVSTEEQRMVLRSMMEAQDQLERNYISRKDEHRALEMQNYMGLSRNTGTFDPDRFVEGEIFRIGMHLEDIKEMIDRNVCEQMSSPQASSTPTHTKEMQPFWPSPACSSSTETSLVCGDDGEDGSRVLSSTDGSLKPTGLDGCSSWIQQGSLEDLNSAEDEEGSEEERGSDRSKISAHLSGSTSSSSQREWKAESCSLLGRAWNTEGEHVSPAVEAPGSSGPASQSLRASSRIVSPETDSGFGSSYLNQSGSGPFEPNFLQEGLDLSVSSAPTRSDASAGSDPQTVIPPAATSPHTSVQASSAAVDGWMQEPGRGEQPSIQPAETRPPPPAAAVGATMDTVKGRSASSCCSCNSEAILALQSEVERLKKDLQDGLVQLPHLAQKMNYLTSQYKQSRPEHRSRILQKSASRSPTKTEDWISSDVEPSKSKDSGCAASYSPAEGRRASSEHSEYSKPHPTRPHRAFLDSVSSRQRWSPLCSPSLQTPLLQVNYGSSSSLPASYKLREPPSQPVTRRRKRSTQSDTALLPSNVFFQQTPSSKTSSRTGSGRGSEGEDMSRTLDHAIEVARSMKRTTDRMARRLSADLAKAQLYRNLHDVGPQGGREPPPHHK